jgi:hypothetical protein
MKGATVDTMALAVEGSAVVLLGVSRAYKESSNCRMEAQYALQKKKPLVPLMLVEGYEADGWLGLMLGTSLWYALYGSTLTSDGAFEDRMDALCRELGDRGRADAHVEDPVDAGPRVSAGHGRDGEQRAVAGGGIAASASAAVLGLEQLQQLKLGALVRYALGQGVDSTALDEADDADNPHAAVLALIRLHCQPRSDNTSSMDSLRAELAGLRYMVLVRRAIEAGVDQEAMDDADGADDSSVALIELILQVQTKDAA